MSTHDIPRYVNAGNEYSPGLIDFILCRVNLGYGIETQRDLVRRILMAEDEWRMNPQPVQPTDSKVTG